MKYFKIFLWTTACLGLGMWMASFDIGGRTPLEHMERAWKQTTPKLDTVRMGAADLIGGAKRKAPTRVAPAELHSKKDRDELEQIIAKRQQK
jgi:hypothetical protein